MHLVACRRSRVRRQCLVVASFRRGAVLVYDSFGLRYLFTCMLGVDFAKASGLGVGCHVGRSILLEVEPPAQSWLLSAELSQNNLDFA